MDKKLNIAVYAIVIAAFAAFAALLYYSVPHEKPMLISYVLKNADYYKSNHFMIKGKPILIYTVSTPNGFVGYYALKDSSGQLPVEGNTQGFELIVGHPEEANTMISSTGMLGNACVHGYYNSTSMKVICDKREMGVVY